MSLRIIYTLERFLSASVGVWVSKNLSKDTRDTGCTLNQLCKRKYWPIAFFLLLCLVLDNESEIW